jgi:hypothetical protein
MPVKKYEKEAKFTLSRNDAEDILNALIENKSSNATLIERLRTFIEVEFESIKRNVVKPKAYIGMKGTITQLPSTEYAMPFYHGKMDNGDNIMFVFSHNDKSEGKIGDRFEITHLKGVDNDFLIFGKLTN